MDSVNAEIKGKDNSNENTINNKAEEMKNNNEVITMDDFLKIKMKLGKIIEAEKIEGMKKILKIRVDIGNEIREIGAGIALFYNPKDIIGKTVVVLTNLQPRKLGNLISNGMILAADGPDGKPLLLTVEDKDPILGSEIH